MAIQTLWLLLHKSRGLLEPVCSIWASNFNNLEEMEEFLDAYTLQRLSHKDRIPKQISNVAVQLTQ